MVRRFTLAAAAVLAALLLAAPAEASWASDGRAIRHGLAVSVRHHRLAPARAQRYRADLRRARRVLPRLPWSRAYNLGAVLHDVARQSRRFSRPRALTLFGMLRLNTSYLARHWLPPYKHDVFDADGIVYRSFPGNGLQFHPLGTFGHLNSLLAHDDRAAAGRLARAMRARGIPRPGRRLYWEYEWVWGGGTPPWTSGMAQAVGAQALARASDRLGKPGLMRAATKAYRSVKRDLTLHLSAGPWVQHYSFSGLVVLNAQLQTAISIGDYAVLARNGGARRFAARLRHTSSRMLHRFDTGYWSLYSLGEESPLSYHLYVVSLLRKLHQRTGKPRWARAAKRFDRYTHEPPKLVGGPTLKVLYPLPPDGFRDRTLISFWLSKPSTVTLRIGGERQTYYMHGGNHVLSWYPGARPPGKYRPHLKAVDLAGNVARVRFHSVRIARDTTPPEVTVRRKRRHITWRAVDHATPWVRLTLRLERHEHAKAVPLGIRPLHGSLTVGSLRARWFATLVVADSSGNRTRVRLGRIGGRG